jgi:hypothetical protein
VSYVDPQTIQNPTTGLIATTALLAQWRTDMQWLRNSKAGCRVRTNVATVIGTNTAIPFELEDYDNQACHSTASNTTRITVPSGWDGMWLFGGVMRFSTGNVSTLMVYKNGSTTTALVRTNSQSNAGNQSSAALTGFERFVAGDYIELCATGGTPVATAFNPVFWSIWWAL